MDPDDPTSIIFNKIRTLEPENATKIIGYFLLQDMEPRDLIRIAHGPDSLLQTFCLKAKSHLGLSSLNPISRPINIHQPLSRNGFFDFSINPNPNPNPNPNNNPLSPSLNSLNTNPNFTSSSSGDENQFLFLNEHKRSYSTSDETEEQGFSPFSGFRFPQVDDFGSSSSGLSERDYICLQRLKLAQQQRLATAKLMASSMSLEKDINFLLQTRQGSGQFGEESGYYYSPNRHERDDSVSRQIYLTFPSDSSFTDEDVSNYFSNFGPVEDVRIPYQQQRMYGFVTFANAETVRIILARGNPHFICDSRVLVKPYKEKGKILQSKRQMQQLQQLLERGNYSPSSSPSALDSRDLYDCHIGPRMFANKTQEMLRRKAEQEADLQQAIEIELQRRRFLNLQLPERDNESVHHNHQRSFSIGSPAHFPPRFNQSLLFQSESNIEETIEGCSCCRGDRNIHEQHFSDERDFYKRQETSLENTLPDSLFGSPKKANETRQTESDTEQH